MADRDTSADDGAKDNSPDEEDPFAGFESSEFSAGEEVDAPAEEPEESDETDDDGDDEDDGDDSSSSRSRNKQTAQERINELTRLRREAEREAEAVKAQLEELKNRPPPPPPESKSAASAEAESDDSEDKPPSPDDFDYGELDPRYITALSRYEVRQEYKALREEEQARRAEEAARQEQIAVQEKFQKQIENGSKKHEDFYEKVVIGAEKGEWPLSEHLGVLLVDSEVGDDIAYHLATHPEESAQVFRQSPLEQARYFGRMEAKFSANQSAATGEDAVKTEKTRTPKAPPPVTPARGSDGRFSPSASTDDFSAFEAHANKQ